MSDDTEKGERIAKVMARAGVASRRDAEKMVVEGRVAVNGQPVLSPATDVLPSDKVTLDGKPIDAPQPARLWLYYKPLGLVTSNRDEKGRQTVFDTLPADMPRVMSVGRLDLTSEGLLLLTNDGELKRRLELPSTGWLRKYRVRVNGRPNDETFAPLRRGITIEGEDFLPMEITLDRQQGANAWLTVGLREGRNREIRRTMTEIGLTVNRLIRVSYGPFRLNTMKPGDVVEVKQRVLRDQLGTPRGDDEGAEEGKRPARSRAGGGDRPRRAPARGGEGEAGDRPFRPRRDSGADPARGGKDRDGERPRKPFVRRDEDGAAPRRPRSGDGDFAPRGERPARSGKPGSGKPGTEGKAPRRPHAAEGERPWKKSAAPRRDGDDGPEGTRRPRRNDSAEGEAPRFRRPREDGDSDRGPRKPYGKAAGDGEGRPRSFGSDGPRKPRSKAAGDGEGRPRSFGSDGPRSRTAKEGGWGRPPREDGAAERKPRPPRSGDRDGETDKPPRRAPYGSGEGKPRTPRAGGAPEGKRPPAAGGQRYGSEGPAGAGQGRPKKDGPGERGPRRSDSDRSDTGRSGSGPAGAGRPGGGGPRKNGPPKGGASKGGPSRGGPAKGGPGKGGPRKGGPGTKR